MEYTERYFLSAGETNAEQEMALPLLAAKLIDIATAHANSLGIGNPHMPRKGCGWVLVRLTIEMQQYPMVNTDYSITTWIESWNRHFSERCFCIADADGNPLGYARSVWMVLDTETRDNAGLGELDFRPEMISDRPCPIARQAKHRKIIADNPVEHHFKYCDLDSYRHVNTVRYISLLLNQSDLATYDANRVNRLELSFLHEACYDQPLLLNIERHDTLHHSFYLETAGDRTPILYARMSFAPRT